MLVTWWVTWSALCSRLQPFISGQATKKLAMEKVSDDFFRLLFDFLFSHRRHRHGSDCPLVFLFFLRVERVVGTVHHWEDSSSSSRMKTLPRGAVSTRLVAQQPPPWERRANGGGGGHWLLSGCSAYVTVFLMVKASK